MVSLDGTVAPAEFTDVSRVAKFELSEEEYATRRGAAQTTSMHGLCVVFGAHPLLAWQARCRTLSGGTRWGDSTPKLSARCGPCLVPHLSSLVPWATGAARPMLRWGQAEEAREAEEALAATMHVGARQARGGFAPWPGSGCLAGHNGRPHVQV